MNRSRVISLLLIPVLLLSFPGIAEEDPGLREILTEATPTDLQPAGEAEPLPEAPPQAGEQQPAEELPAGTETETPTDVPTDPPADAQTDAPTETPGETPAAPSTGTPAEPPAETAAETPTAAPADPPAPRHFSEGYVLLKQNTRAYADEAGQELLGTFTGDAAVYAFSFRQAENPARDVLKIVFDTRESREKNEPLPEAYLIAALAEPLEAEPETDPQAREYAGRKIPLAAFRYPEQAEPPAEGAVTANTAAENAGFSVKVPSSVKAGIGKKVKIKAKVSKKSKHTAYRWQESTDGGATWQDCGYSGHDKKTLKVPVTEQRFFHSLFRCQVTIKNETVTSGTVSFRSPYSIKVSPESRELKKGKTGAFRVKVKSARGKIHYRWQVSRDGGLTWQSATKEKGRKTRTLTVKGKDSAYGSLYRCVVSASKGKAISPAVRVDQPGAADYDFEPLGDGWKVARYTGTKASVTVPDSYSGKPVTAVGDGAFKGNTTLKTVKIPKTITAIGANAFDSCVALTAVTLTDSVTSIGREAFRNCPSLTDISISE